MSPAVTLVLFSKVLDRWPGASLTGDLSSALGVCVVPAVCGNMRAVAGSPGWGVRLGGALRRQSQGHRNAPCALTPWAL